MYLKAQTRTNFILKVKLSFGTETVCSVQQLQKRNSTKGLTILASKRENHPDLNFYMLAFTGIICKHKVEVMNHPENVGKCTLSLLYIFLKGFYFLE